jgi:hypothetical protein
MLHGLPFSHIPNLKNLITDGQEDKLFNSARRYKDLAIVLADKSRVEFAKLLANATSPMALSLDGTTNESNQKAVVVSVRAILEGHRIDTFLDLIEVEAEDAATTLTAMLSRLEAFGITEEKLKERLICVTTDGASVMQGVRQGVATKLCQMFGPRVVMVHCYAHRVELVFKTGKENEIGVQKILSAVNDLYSL